MHLHSFSCILKNVVIKDQQGNGGNTYGKLRRFIYLFDSIRKRRAAVRSFTGNIERKILGTGSGNLSALEEVLNEQAAKGYRLHTITTASAQSGGLLGGDRIQATMVFEKI